MFPRRRNNLNPLFREYLSIVMLSSSCIREVAGRGDWIGSCRKELTQMWKEVPGDWAAENVILAVVAGPLRGVIPSFPSLLIPPAYTLFTWVILLTVTELLCGLWWWLSHGHYYSRGTGSGEAWECFLSLKMVRNSYKTDTSCSEGWKRRQ